MTTFMMKFFFSKSFKTSKQILCSIDYFICYSCSFESETWYQELKATNDITYLSNADFTTGTYQITTPGRYVFSEDIVFDPNPDNDGFPVIGDPRFPMNKYFLGFFAAITIETSDVWIDLNGYSIVQSEHHNAMQRFYNHIELADRVFIKFEGMASLNYQTNDKILYNEESSQRHGKVKQCIIVRFSFHEVRSILLRELLFQAVRLGSLRIMVSTEMARAILLWRI